MVRATVIITAECTFCEEEMRVICPFCDSLVDMYSVDYDDYVSDNWVYYCECGHEHFICKFLEEDATARNESPDECTIQLSPEEVKAVCEKKNLGYEEYFRAYRVGVLKLKFVLPEEQIPDDVEDIDGDVRAAYTDETFTRGFHIDECFSLNEARTKTHNALRHDGCNLGYVGECSECGQEYISTIWGD